MYLKRPHTPQRIEVAVEVEDRDSHRLRHRIEPWIPTIVFGLLVLILLAVHLHQIFWIG